MPRIATSAAVLAICALACALPAQLNGTYTCANGNPGNAFDYADIGQFIDALNAQGVAGPVTLNVFDDGGPFVSNASYNLGSIELYPHAANGVTAAKPLVIRAAPGENPVITGSGAYGGIATLGLFDISFTTLQGLEFRNGANVGLVCLGQGDSMAGIRISRCRFRDMPGTAIVIRGSLGLPSPIGIVIENNWFWDCLTQPQTAYNNAAVVTAFKPGIEWIVRHNTVVYRNAPALPAGVASGAFYFGAAVYGAAPIEQFFGNAVYVDSTAPMGGACVFFDPPPLFADHNVYHIAGTIDFGGTPASLNETFAEWQAQGYDANGVVADPMLVDVTPSQMDLRLRPGSPCIDRVPLAAVNVDILGQNRPFGPARDAGAHEFIPPEIAIEYAAAPIAPVGVVNAGNIGPAGAARIFTVRNVGTVDLQLTFNPPVVIVPGANCGAATAVQVQPAALIPPAGFSTFTLFIQPAAPGPMSLSVSIANTDPLRNPFVFTVNATGLPGNQPAFASAPAGSALIGPVGGPFACALMPGASPVNANLQLADPEGDTITVQSSVFVGAVIPGLTGPPVPAPGQPLALAWTGLVDAATAPGVYTWRLVFIDAVNQTPVLCDIVFTVGDLPPVHVITGATAGAGTMGAPYECAFTRGEGAATSIGLCLVTDPNAGQTASIAAQAALPGNPGAVGFVFAMAGPVLRIAPAAMLTVAEAGQHLYEAQLTDGLNTISIYVAILVNNPPMNFTTPAALPNGETGTPYTQTLALTGAIAPSTFTVTAGALADGLALDANTGAITGTPTQAESASFTVQATDSTGATASRAFTLEITTPPSPPPPNKPATGNGCAAGAGGGVGLIVVALALCARRRRQMVRST